MTMSSGLYSCLRLPTALADSRYSTPSILKPRMFARKFSSDGERRWPAPCRARNATRLPRSVPRTYGPDGSPNGVVTAISLRSVTSAISYRPEPPMMPIWTCSMCPFAGASAPAAHTPKDAQRGGFSPRGLQHLLHETPVVLLSNVSCGHDRVM